MPTTEKTVTQAFSFGALAACSLVLGASCASTSPTKLSLVEQAALKKETQEIVERSKTLGADFETRSAGLADAVASEDQIAVEVKLFQYPDRPDELKHPPIAEPKTLGKAAAEAWIQDRVDDRRVTTVSYPRVLTKNGRTVKIHSVANHPFVEKQDPENSETTIGYLPTGTEIAVCPTLLKDGSIDVNATIQITNITGSALVDGNKHPVASSDLYRAVPILREGETLLFTGGKSNGEDGRIDIAITATKA